MITVPKKYICEICGRKDADKHKIESCEKRGILKKILKVGDKFYFKNSEKDIEYLNRIDPTSKYGYTAMKCLIFFENVTILSIRKIDISGHERIYYVDQEFYAGDIVGNGLKYPIFNQTAMEFIVSMQEKYEKESLIKI